MSRYHRIIHVLPGEPFGGLQVIVLELAKAQRTAGHDVMLLLTSPSSMLIDRTVEAGVPFHLLQGNKVSRMANLRRWLGRRRASIVHSHCEPIWAMAIMLSLRLPAWIVHLHVYASRRPGWKGRLMKWMHRQAASRFIAITHSVAQSHLDWGAARSNKVDVIYNGLPVRSAVNGADRDRPFTICFAGRVVVEKGIMDFVRLAERMRQEPQMRFVVAGEGAELQAARNLASKIGIDDSIEFRSFVPDMSALWREVDVLAMLSKREPFGLVILEAIAAGVSVIGYDAPSGGQEIMATIPGCHLVEAGSIEALASCIGAIRSNPAETEQALLAGADRVKRQFSVERMAADISRSYGLLNGAVDGNELNNRPVIDRR